MNARQKKKTFNVLLHFASHCDAWKPILHDDMTFEIRCFEEAGKRGYPLEGAYSLKPFIQGGIPMALNAYRHLLHTPVPVLIALYTAFLIYLDDVLKTDVEAVGEFHERMFRGVKQKDPILGHFCELLSEMPRHFDRVISNLMISSTLNFINALLLEDVTEGMVIREGVTGYPTFSRVMSGASEVFALALFRRIRHLPELMTFINNGNDVLSFYKEECDNESVNRISLLARCMHTSKHAALVKLSNDAITAHHTVLQILKGSQDALDAYKAFSYGYIAFYWAYKRYRLRELESVITASL
ncbi:terpenoid synthase [Hymenopellis radicata]|nr:terpenoid synthase [Hymenopellis radicata]